MLLFPALETWQIQAAHTCKRGPQRKCESCQVEDICGGRTLSSPVVEHKHRMVEDMCV